MRERQIEDWTVYKCLGCNSEPYALHSIKREGRVLVSDNIKVCCIVCTQRFLHGLVKV